VEDRVRDVWTIDPLIEQKMTASDLVIFAEALNTFCSRMETVTIDGASRHIGSKDGNPRTVQFYDNAFHIWLRTLV
jgi:hypothetical protein